MKLIAGLSAAALLSGGLFAYSSMGSATSGTPVLVVAPDRIENSTHAERLEFRDIVDFSGATPHLGERALSLSGKRDRVAGYIAHLELQPRHGFFLVPIPVHGDESGAGRGDLPLQSIFVVTRKADGSFGEPVDSQVEVVGVLDVGHREDADGNAHWLRVFAES